MIVLAYFERDTAAIQLARLGFDSLEQHCADTRSAHGGIDEDVVDVDQRTRDESRKSQEADREADRLAFAICQPRVARRMRAQARHQLALDPLRQRLAALQRFTHELVEHRDQRLLMLTARQVSIDDG